MTYPPPPGDPSWQATPPPGDPSWQTAPPPVPPPPPQQSQHVWLYVVFGTVVALLVTGGVWFGVSMIGDTNGGKKSDQSQVSEPKAEVDGGGIVVGDSGPKVDIYLDFICPACGSFQTEHDGTLQTAITDKTAILVFHPLNFLENASTDDYSARAASASVCAADDGKFYDYYRILMQNQPPEGGAGLDDDKLIELGSEAGLDDGFADCVNDGTYVKWIDQETDKALESGIGSTPTIRIDGKSVESQSFATEFAEAVK